VATHIQGAQGWLDRAAREWAAGARARAILALSLAEAEVRLAKHLAATEPVPAARRPVTLVAAAGLVVALALAGGLRWPAAPVSEQVTAHAATAAVSLGYVPGRVLALVAPPQDRLVGRPWTQPPADEATVWLQALLREAGLAACPGKVIASERTGVPKNRASAFWGCLEPEAAPADPVIFR